MWREELKKVVEIEKRFNADINTGCPEEDIAKLKTRWTNLFDTELPEEYLEVLKELNGLNFNGYTLFGYGSASNRDQMAQKVYDLIEFNSVWYELEDNRICILLGQSGISWYVYMFDDCTYQLQDLPSGDTMDIFATFEDMFDSLLKDSLLGISMP